MSYNTHQAGLGPRSRPAPHLDHQQLPQRVGRRRRGAQVAALPLVGGGEAGPGAVAHDAVIQQLALKGWKGRSMELSGLNGSPHKATLPFNLSSANGMWVHERRNPEPSTTAARPSRNQATPPGTQWAGGRTGHPL